MEKRTQSELVDSSLSEIADWIGWARSKADQIDPLVRPLTELPLEPEASRHRRCGGEPRLLTTAASIVGHFRTAVEAQSSWSAHIQREVKRWIGRAKMILPFAELNFRSSGLLKNSAKSKENFGAICRFDA